VLRECKEKQPLTFYHVSREKKSRKEHWREGTGRGVTEMQKDTEATKEDNPRGKVSILKAPVPQKKKKNRDGHCRKKVWESSPERGNDRKGLSFLKGGEAWRTPATAKRQKKKKLPARGARTRMKLAGMPTRHREKRRSRKKALRSSERRYLKKGKRSSCGGLRKLQVASRKKEKPLSPERGKLGPQEKLICTATQPTTTESASQLGKRRRQKRGSRKAPTSTLKTGIGKTPLNTHEPESDRGEEKNAVRGKGRIFSSTTEKRPDLTEWTWRKEKAAGKQSLSPQGKGLLAGRGSLTRE